MQRVAITGCASRFGRVLLPLLETDPTIERIIGIDLVPPVGTYSKLEFHAKDVRDTDLQEIFQGCDTVVHLAFIVGRPYSMSLQEAASVNLAGTWNTCSAAASASVPKLVVSSSIAAYGSLPDNPPVLSEDSPLRGLYTEFYYSQHKHANEIWLDGLQLKYPQLLISRLRPCIVIGPNQVAANSMIQPNRTYFTAKEAYQSRLQLIHEDDLAAAFYIMITHDLPGAYNVVGDGPDSMPNIAASAGFQVIEVPAEMIVQAVDTAWKEGKTTLGPEWVSMEGDIICSNARLKETGLWSPRYTTTQAYAATAEAIAPAGA
ncbi:MAG TPA: NAD-dependent epimerase/dehydratase family protein [Ktedonobacteraceae bacterium]|nr:NAD-dependent epimerase/dehydratase family protein [Ktedonobacteraceae bacterium]